MWDLPPDPWKAPTSPWATPTRPQTSTASISDIGENITTRLNAAKHAVIQERIYSMEEAKQARDEAREGILRVERPLDEGVDYRLRLSRIEKLMRKALMYKLTAG
jgi:hypothetical protein